MAGIHIAEKLDIPYFGSFPFPWTRTKNFPHPFAVAGRRMGGSYNVMTYMVIEQVLWTGTSSQINKWRKNTLELPAISIDQLEPQKVPYLYSFSPSIVPPPSDWHDWIHPCGYWFLDQPDHDWIPPQDLVDFIKGGEKPPVYIGFGSIVVQDPDHLTQTIIDAVVESGCRVILSEGWSARGKEDRKAFEFPSCIYPLKSVPHDWLFPQVSAVVHHGGAGTTAAGLRAGVPTIIHPYFGDQYFWAQQVQNSGCGIYLKKLTVEKLSKALVTATSDPKMIEKAGLIGKQIRSEDGVEKAINFIYRDIDAARKRLDRYKQLSKQSKVIPSIIPGLLSPTSAESQDKQGLPISILSDGEESGWCLVDSNAQVQN
jgi:sterol 3beta-glucosyltransferase